MNKHDKSAGQPLTGLPSPRSPRDLDLRILRYARDQAPERPPRRASRWVTGLAFASVTGLALFLVLPTRPPTTGLLEEAAEMQEERRPGGAATAPKAPVPHPAGKIADPGLRARMSPASGNSAGLAADPPGSDGSVPGRPRDPAASYGQKDLSAIGPRNEKTAAITPVPSLSEALENLADMLARGEADAAHEAYHALRRECPACELPPTLEQAIADRLPVQNNRPRP